MRYSLLMLSLFVLLLSGCAASAPTGSTGGDNVAEPVYEEEMMEGEEMTEDAPDVESEVQGE